MSEIISCPVCSHLLIKEQNTYKCENNHTFDLAKEGYLNLLLNAKKTSGDSKEMMAARRDFLAKGYYEKLSDRVNQRLKKSHSTDQAILDIGCGEGYYLSRFQKEIAPKASNFYGMDISKLGIRMAAKKNPMIHWLVANFAKLPFKDKSVSTVLSMFAEYSVPEIDRILTDDGNIIIVRAANNHLIELKNIIYPEIHEKVKTSSIKTFPGFCVEQENFSYKVTIQSTEDLLSLLLMTPHYWKIKPEGIENLKKFESLEVTISIEIDLLKRQKKSF
ncbi:putative RNA methyltransferase [Lactococcus lactis]|uniref:putative RNA methyltransferase n=2 Tax=Lactococcus lactis TaxID=1358 RepID=UPI0026543787|nr:methyltransferase domain-containing protein [Lactococcus lactis]MDN6279021.1 methyltransferase domain-containing protein [Lactococcus lactis]MDR7696401.1 methyltransferase domain-containing protein [Lactococcus lactis]